MKSVIRLFAIVFTSIFVLIGCASINKAPAEHDAAAKRFAVNADSAQLYIFRDQTFGAAISMPVTINGKLIGNTGPKSFFKLDVPQGTHAITSQGVKSAL